MANDNVKETPKFVKYAKWTGAILAPIAVIITLSEIIIGIGGDKPPIISSQPIQITIPSNISMEKNVEEIESMVEEMHKKMGLSDSNGIKRSDAGEIISNETPDSLSSVYRAK